jgi:phytoene dehydrogenase-like protein
MGGMGAISDAIAAAGRSHGMQIRTAAPVARILVRGGRARASRLRTAPSCRPRPCCPARTQAVVARQVLTPLDLEQRYGLTEGNIFHGDIRPDQLFHMRPVPGWARYATPTCAARAPTPAAA